MKNRSLGMNNTSSSPTSFPSLPSKKQCSISKGNELAPNEGPLFQSTAGDFPTWPTYKSPMFPRNNFPWMQNGSSSEMDTDSMSETVEKHPESREETKSDKDGDKGDNNSSIWNAMKTSKEGSRLIDSESAKETTSCTSSIPESVETSPEDEGSRKETKTPPPTLPFDSKEDFPATNHPTSPHPTSDPDSPPFQPSMLKQASSALEAYQGPERTGGKNPINPLLFNMTQYSISLNMNPFFQVRKSFLNNFKTKLEI